MSFDISQRLLDFEMDFDSIGKVYFRDYSDQENEIDAAALDSALSAADFAKKLFGVMARKHNINSGIFLDESEIYNISPDDLNKFSHAFLKTNRWRLEKAKLSLPDDGNYEPAFDYTSLAKQVIKTGIEHDKSRLKGMLNNALGYSNRTAELFNRQSDLSAQLSQHLSSPAYQENPLKEIGQLITGLHEIALSSKIDSDKNAKETRRLSWIAIIVSIVGILISVYFSWKAAHDGEKSAAQAEKILNKEANKITDALQKQIEIHSESAGLIRKIIQHDLAGHEKPKETRK